MKVYTHKKYINITCDVAVELHNLSRPWSRHQGREKYEQASGRIRDGEDTVIQGHNTGFLKAISGPISLGRSEVVVGLQFERLET